jgi:hypothetical protein
VILAGCGGGSTAKPQPVVGDGFRFSAPAGWRLERKAGIVRASDGAVDLVSVRTFPLLKTYRPGLFRAVSKELDGVASQLADQLGGQVGSSTTVTVAGRKARSYRIDYQGKAQEITFVLRGKREFQLLCRRDVGAKSDACGLLVSSFALA